MKRLFAILFLASAAASAQRDARWEASTLFGFRANGTLTLSAPGSTLARGSLDSAGLFSLTGGYRLDDQNLIEFRYSRNSPGISLDAPVNGASAKLESSMNQFAGDFTYEFSPENSDTFRPYILGSVGATRLTITGLTHTRLHLGLGFGAKYWLRPRIGIRAQGAWMPTVWNRTDGAFACVGGAGGAACITASGARWVHQVEFSIGPVFRF